MTSKIINDNNLQRKYLYTNLIKIMDNKYYTSFLLLIISLSCSNLNNKNDNIKQIEHFEEEKVLSGKTIGLNNYFKNPQSCDFLDSMLMIIDKGTENAINFVSLDNYSIIASYGNRGKGPAEFVNAPSSFNQISLDKKHIFILEWDKARFSKYNIDSMMNNKDYFPDRFFVAPPELGLVYGMLFVNDTLLIGTSQNGKGRLFKWNIKNNQLNYFPWIPKPEKKVIPQALAQLYYERIAIKPDHRYIVSSMDYFNRIDIFTNELELFKTLLFSKQTNPLSEYKDNTIYWNNIVNYFGPDIFVTNNYIYALYKGFTDKEFNEKPSTVIKSQIQIFDWNGNAKYRLKLDRFIYPFTVDEKNKIVYGIDYLNPTQPLIKYKY